MRSRVPDTTLPPSYPGRAILLLISLKSSINRLHEVGETTRVGETTLIFFRPFPAAGHIATAEYYFSVLGGCGSFLRWL